MGRSGTAGRRAIEFCAEILSEATGRKIAPQPVTDAEVWAGLLAAGMSERAADGIVGMTAGTRDGFTPEQPRTAVTTTPTTLGEWAYEHLRPRLA